MRRARAVARFAGATLLSSVVLALATPPALAEPDDREVEIVIDSLSPLVAGPGDRLHITGTIANSSQEAIDAVEVILRKSSVPVRDPGQLAAIEDAPMSPESGSPDDVALPGTRETVATHLAPGARARFDIALPVSSLALPGPGTYALGIEARGTSTAKGEHRLDDMRTFLPWYPQGSVAPVSLVWLWPLAAAPARNAAGVFMDERLPADLAPGGRLTRLLSIGERQPELVSWIADPSVLQAADDMSDGYLVQDGATLRAGEREGSAATWLKQLGIATDSGADLHTLPYANIDASAATRAGMSTDVVRAVTQGPQMAGALLAGTTAGGLYWAPSGRLDRAAMNVLASAGVTTVVLSSSSMPAVDPALDLTASPVTALPTSTGSIRAILADSELTALLGRGQESATESIAARQRFLAYTAMAAQAADESGQTEPFLVAAPGSVLWDPHENLIGPLLRATRQAPWLRSATLTDISARQPGTASRQRGGYGTKARSLELTESYMASVRAISDSLATFTSIIDDPTGVTEPYAQALLRAQSAAWRGQPTEAQRLIRSINRELVDDTSRVRVLSSGTVTLSGDAGKVPVTIANDLDRSVTVGLRLVGQPALRLDSTPVPAVTIEPGKMASVDVDVRVVGGDPLTVDLQLTTPDQMDFAAPTSITVMSTAYSRAAAWVVAAAFLAIVVFVVVGVTRRIHAASRSAGR